MSQVVHCPKCHSAVSVGPNQSGQRVQCPSCLKQFLAPSNLAGAGSTSEDDDWLSLDDSPSPTTAAQSSPPAAGTKSLYTPPATIEQPPQDSAQAATPNPPQDSFESDPFADLPPVGTPSDSPGTASPLGQAEADPSDLFAGLPPIDQSSETTAPAAAQSGDPEQEFRVKCPVCSSVLYAKAKQTGKTIRCGDCHTEIKVPKPPKKTTQVQSNPNAATFNLAETGATGRPADPYKKSADELLREAEHEREGPEFTPAYDAPSTIGWVKSVFGIFIDPGVIIHFVGLTLLLGLPAALTFAYPMFAIGAAPLAMLGVTLTVACGFAIMFGVANGHKRIEGWPTADPTGWFESIGLVIAATAIAVGPAYILATLLGATAVLTIGLVMLSVYFTFPFILLSMLDMQSVTTPFSPDVGKSITRCQEDWGAFYFSSGVLFAFLLMVFMMSPYTPLAVAIGVSLSIAVAFMYFAMLGRLALAIGEVVELTALDTDDEEEEDDDA